MRPYGSLQILILSAFLILKTSGTDAAELSAEYMNPLYSDYVMNEIGDNSIDNLVPDDEEQHHPLNWMPLRLPNVQPTEKDTYLCHSYDFTSSGVDQYIVGFQPNASMDVAHHILLYGCTEPGYPAGDLWACGEMAGNTGKHYKKGSTCRAGSQIVYAWARDAPSLDLPEGVGFKVGINSNIKSIVLQVHYANVDSFIAGGTDNSGITLKITEEPMSKLAGVYLLGTAGQVPEGESHLESACRVNQPGLVMHPFAFRTHTHHHGKVVSGYVIKNGKWIKIGKHDPMKPQMFYPVLNKTLTVKNNDILAARCTMQNNDGHVVPIGSTHNDEMCNFYMMYWAYTLCQEKYCFSSGLPYYHWSLKKELQHAPPRASVLDAEDM